MFVKCKKSKCILMCVTILALALWTVGAPASLLVKKAASSDEQYVLGWEDGCQTGANANAIVNALLSNEPFKKQNQASDQYKGGWNEGFTICRFFQSAWSELFGLFLVILTLIATRCRCGEAKCDTATKN